MPTKENKINKGVHQDDHRITELLDRLDSIASMNLKRKAKRENDAPPPTEYPYRTSSVARLQRPGDQEWRVFRIPTRSISKNTVTFLFGGFVNFGTLCEVQLTTPHGAWEDLPGRVVDCRYVEGTIHEVEVRFFNEIDPSLYCASAIHTRVLLAEDDPFQARLTKFFLNDLNAEVDYAQNGQIAIEKALKNSYDVILMDLDMPVVDGMKAIQEIRRQGYSAPVVAVTAMTRPGDRDKCLEIGFDQYLPKPYNKEKLSQILLSLHPEPLFSNFHNDSRMAPFVNEFVQHLPAKIREVEMAVARKEKTKLLSLVRELKGQGAGYGFGVITDAATEVEQQLLNDEEFPANREKISRLTQLCLQARPCPIGDEKAAAK